MNSHKAPGSSAATSRPTIGDMVRNLKTMAWPVEARDATRERYWHIWTEAEIDDYAVAWGVSRTVAEMVLNFQQLEAAAARYVSLENLGLLAERIAAWGAEMCRGGQMMERERYQEQGE